MEKDDFLKNKFLRDCLKNKESAVPGIFEVILILDHLKAGPNIGKILRTAEVMGVKAVYIIGTKYFDPTPAKGALKRVPLVFCSDFKSIYPALHEQGYQFFATDLKAKNDLGFFSLPKKSAFIFGHEGFGLLMNLSLYPLILKIKIKQFGKTQSLNVAQAAAMSLYEYSRQHGLEIES